jgi:hypothetical protein
MADTDKERPLVDFKDVQRLLDSQVLVPDPRRRRPRYFDGRFLAARDLTREQIYFLTRQADYGRAAGFGVVHGLLVRALNEAGADVEIAPGHGITPSGETVMLGSAVRVRLSDALASEQLDAAFGLRRIPSEALRNRSGLFVLALRPVEFSANPIAAYPTSIAGDRRVEDGDIIEATALSLIPWPDQVASADLELARGRIARDLFLGGRAARGLPENALPLAMVALSRGVLQWSDSFLVRREIGSDREDILGLGFAPRALREAHLHQYVEHLQRIVAVTGGQPFSAASWLGLLPPAGPLPDSAIDASDFTQRFFPPEVDVQLTVLPEDELAAIAEESLLLPPIDLAEGGDALESTSILALAPVSRSQFRTLTGSLAAVQRRLAAAAPNLVARRRPLELLRGIRAPWLPLAPLEEAPVADQPWRDALAQAAGRLWYTRRRNLAYSRDFVGDAVERFGDERGAERALDEQVESLGLSARWKRVRNQSTASGTAEMVRLLSAPKFARSPALLAAAIQELDSRDPVERREVLGALERFVEPGFGEGLMRLEQAAEGLRQDPEKLRKLAQSGAVAELDALARMATERELAELAGEVATRADSPKKLGDFARARFREVGP